MAMTLEARARMIESYGTGYTQLVEALDRFPKEMWTFRDEHGCWSIREHIIHIAESEVNSYIRCRRLIAEPCESLMAYDENRWASALAYRDQDIEDTLELFRWLRQKSFNLISDLPEPTWGHTAYHLETGDMTLDDWLDVYERHVPEHVRSMQENYDAWAGSC
jgi:hypothetical protein